MTIAEMASAIPSWSEDERLQLLDELWASVNHGECLPKLTSDFASSSMSELRMLTLNRKNW